MTQVLDRLVTRWVFFEEVIREILHIGRPGQVRTEVKLWIRSFAVRHGKPTSFTTVAGTDQKLDTPAFVDVSALTYENIKELASFGVCVAVLTPDLES